MRYFIITLIISMLLAGNSTADTVTLENGHSINGIIVEEDESSVVLNAGCGTITLPRSDIEFIERSDEVTNRLLMEKWRKQYFENFPAPTQEEQALLDEFKDLKYEKEQLERNITKKANMAKKVSLLQNDISRLQDKLTEIGEKIKSAEPQKDLVKYNVLVVEFNSLNGKLKDTVDELNELQKEYKLASGEGVRYINRLSRFRKLFEEKYKEAGTKDMSEQKKNFYANLKERLDILKKDIKQKEVEFAKRENGIVVTAEINKEENIVMLVDTGAALTVLTEGAAIRSGIDPTGLKQDIELILADGRRMPAKFVLLNSLSIGDAEVNNVEAAVIEEGPSKGIDGLLGMSFLKHFSFSIDSENQKLIFSSFGE